MTDTRYYTKLEVEIQSFISKYGVDELVKWLSEYSKIVSTSDFNMFHRIQKFTCEEYNIPIADINSSNSTRIDYANAKKTITYMTYTLTRLQPKHLSMLQGCTTRTIYNHTDTVKFWIKNPSAYRGFVEKYNKILKKIENHDTSNP